MWLVPVILVRPQFWIPLILHAPKPLLADSQLRHMCSAPPVLLYLLIPLGPVCLCVLVRARFRAAMRWPHACGSRARFGPTTPDPFARLLNRLLATLPSR